MKILILYITSSLLIFKVIFPLISYPKKKDDKIIFNQSPIIDILQLTNITILFIFMISTGAITKLREPGFELLDKRVKVK